MILSQGLARGRHHIRHAYRTFLEQWARSRPPVEALESRVMMSVVPVNAEPVDLASVKAANGVVAAYAHSGRFAVAWDDVVSEGLQGVFFNLYDDKAQVVSTGGAKTGFIATGAAASGVEIAVSDSGRGVVTWVVSQTVFAQQFSMVDGSLIGEVLTVPTVQDPATGAVCPVAQAKVAMAANGDFAIAWMCGLQRQVTEADGTDPLATWVSGVYVATYDVGSGGWNGPATTVAQPTILPAKGTTVTNLDLAMKADGAFVVGWNTGIFDLRTSQDSSGGKRGLAVTDVEASYQSFNADGQRSGKVVSVGRTKAGLDYTSAVIDLAMDSSGALTVVNTLVFRDATAPYEQLHNKVFRRSYDASGKATTALLPVLQTDASHRIGSMTCTYDSSHRLLLMWQLNEWDFQNGKADVTLQTISGDGKKVLSSEALNLKDTTSAGECTLLPAGDMLRLAYVDTGNTNAERPYAGTIRLIDYAANGVDLALSVGGGSLRRALTAGQTVTGSLPVTLTNLGNAVAKGTATITVTLSVNGETRTLATSDVMLNLKGGAAKTFTLKNVIIAPADYVESGDPEISIAIAFKDEQGKSTDLNADNNAVSETMYVGDADADKSPDLTPVSGDVHFSQSVLVPGDHGSASVVIRNMGDADFRNQKVNIIVTAVPFFGSETSVIADRTVRLSLKSGLDATLNIPLLINGGCLPGSHHFEVRVVTYDADGWKMTDHLIETTETVDVTWAVGNVVGRKGNTSMVLRGDYGDSVTYSMSGPGYTLIKPYIESNGNYHTDAGIPLVFMYTFDSTRASSVKVSARGVDRIARIAEVFAYSDLGSFSAAKSMTYGRMGFHEIRNLTLGDFTSSGQHSIIIYTDSTQTVNMTAKSLSHTTLDCDMAIGTLSVSEWINVTADNAAILAPTIQRLETHVDPRQDVYGHFAGDIVLRGIDKDGDGTGDYDQVALKNASIAGYFSSDLTVAGAIGTLKNGGVTLYTTIRTTGNIDTLLLERLEESSILAGIADSVSGALVDNGKHLPTSESDFVHNTDGTVRDVRIGSITVKLKWDAALPYSERFYIAAASIGKVKLDTVNGAKASGIAVLESATAKKKAFESVSYNYWVQLNPNQSTVRTATWTPATPGPWTFGSFGLTVIDRG